MSRAPAQASFPRSKRRLDFGGPKLQASPYPSAVNWSGLAPPPVELTGKPLSGLSWLSYSSPGFVARSPSAVRHPSLPVSRRSTPHASQVVRASRDLHPNCPQALALTPWAGFAPALNHSDRAEARYVLVAQPRRSRLGRSLGLSSHLQSDKVLRQTAPIEPDEHVSVRPGSTSQYRGRWLVCPPGPVGETGFVGWYCLPGSVSKAFHVPDNSGPPSWIAAGGRYQRTEISTKKRPACMASIAYAHERRLSA